MKNKWCLSDNTKAYVEQYQDIFDEMTVNMSATEHTDSISGNFITQMIPHHRAAIAMSENLLRYTTNIPLQNIARNIISSQQKSIRNMLKVRPVCQKCTNTMQELTCYQMENKCVLDNMFCEMKSACTNNNIDCNFMREMIPHHRGAVNMSEHALGFCLCQELVPLLDAIIKSQKEGIHKMQQQLRQTGC